VLPTASILKKTTESPATISQFRKERSEAVSILKVASSSVATASSSSVSASSVDSVAKPRPQSSRSAFSGAVRERSDEPALPVANSAVAQRSAASASNISGANLNSLFKSLRSTVVDSSVVRAQDTLSSSQSSTRKNAIPIVERDSVVVSPPSTSQAQSSQPKRMSRFKAERMGILADDDEN
jgi:hypothetical protein